MSVRKDIKSLLAKSDTTLKFVAEQIRIKTGRNISADNLSQKLRKGTLRYDDAVLIADILEYDLQFVKRNCL